MCDGKRDCPGNDDELQCECDPQKEFACSPAFGSGLGGGGGGQCISLAFVCDGVEQCLNGRDEADCCNNYCDDGVTCIQDDRDGIQCGLIYLSVV